MKVSFLHLLLFAPLAWFLLPDTPALAQDGSIRAVRVHATTQAAPPRITLHWEVSPHVVDGIWVYRRAPGAANWDYLGTSTTTTSYIDNNVSVGTRYEYKVYRTYADLTVSSRGYTIAGIEAPLIDQRGTVILLVDSSKHAPLAAEIARFKNDLAGDGWTVVEETVGPSETPASVRAKLQTIFNTDPAHVKAAILFGRIPVPYSGDIFPDGHSSHRGAWPADTYYADLTGEWTDTTVSQSTASQSRHHNIPGDGKFDQSKLPSAADIAIGRIDMSNLSGFGAGGNETELLRNYLRKNHEFRHRLGEFAEIPKRGLIRDSFGSLSGEAPASAGWRGFSAMFGSANVTASANWFPTLETNKYLWAYGGGSGTYTSASGTGSSNDFKTKNSLAVFQMLFGSYFGDWDSPTDNFLRAPMAGAAGSLGLVSVWANRPDWHVHGMALGETIGDAYLRTVNNPSDFGEFWTQGYFISNQAYAQMVHVALMGDPTLRLHSVGSSVGGAVSRTPGDLLDDVTITWQAVSESDLVGYHVYRSEQRFGPYTRLTTTPSSQLSFNDTTAPKAKVYYQVRAVVLTSSGSGTYLNTGQALTYSVPISAPTTAPTNVTATAISASTIGLSWTSDDADTFILHRRISGTSGWSEVAELDGTLRQYQDTGLTGGTTYEYRIIADNLLGESPPSNITYATTLSATILVFDSFTDGGVTNGADPLDVNWSKTDANPSNTTFGVVPDSTLDPIAPHHVAELHIDASNTERYLYFPLPNEVQLGVGEGLRFAFKLRHTGTPRPDVSTTSFSLAHTPSNAPWNNAANKEYWVRTSYGTAGTLGTIRKTLAQQVLNTGTELQSGTASINAGTDVISISFEVTRTTTSQMRIRYRLNGGAIQETFDNTDIITAFNRVFFRFRTRNDPENPGDPRFRLDNITVETIPAPPPPPLTPLQIWQAAHFTPEQLADPELEATVWGFRADPDGDNISNILEYALLDGNPLSPGAATQPVLGSLTIADIKYLTLTVSKNAAAADITHLVETSTDLTTWQSGTDHTVIVADTESELTVRTAAPLSNAPRRFLRLRVTYQE